MFLELSKVLDLAVSPLTWALVLAAGAALAWRRRGASAALAAAATLVLYAFSTGLVANALQRGAEAGVEATARDGSPYDAVVVLTGMVDGAASRASGRTELTAAADRIVAGFELLREGRARQVLLSGGPVDERLEDSEAEQLAGLLRRWGIDPARIVVESRSRNTHENAVEAARVVRERGWRTLLLVTSAAHMPRAAGCFRKVGLTPDLFPVDRRVTAGTGGRWLPRAAALAQSTDVLRELTGRLVYRLVGYT